MTDFFFRCDTNRVTFFNRFSSKKLLIVLLIGTVLLVILNILLVSEKRKTPSVVQATPTPFTIWKQYSDAANTYYLPVPPQWTIEQKSNPQDTTTTFDFTNSGKTYGFTISPPSNIFPDMSLVSNGNVFLNKVVYGKKPFTKRIWTSNNIPFFVVATADDPNFIFYAFSMQIPPDDYQKYLSLFDQIMNKIVIEKSLQLPQQ